MSKFKVGDKVRVRSDLANGIRYASNGFPAFWCFVMNPSTFANRVFEISRVSESLKYGAQYHLQELPCVWTDEMFSVLAEPTREFIVPRRDGQNVIASHKRGDEIVKTAKATCSPADTFDFYKGAELALDRLMGREEAKKETKPTMKTRWNPSKCAEQRSSLKIGDRVRDKSSLSIGTVVGFEHDGKEPHGIDWVYVEWDAVLGYASPKLEKDLIYVAKKPDPKPAPAPKAEPKLYTGKAFAVKEKQSGFPSRINRVFEFVDGKCVNAKNEDHMTIVIESFDQLCKEFEYTEWREVKE